MKAPAVVLFLCFLLGCGSANSAPADRNNICPGLQVPAGRYSEVYVKGTDDVIKPLDHANLQELAGRRILFCYVAIRSPWDLPGGVPQQGAISVKVEFWEANPGNLVYLYNNHLSPAKTCKARTFE